MNVGSLIADSHEENHIDQPANGGGIGLFHQGFEIDTGFGFAPAFGTISFKFLDKISDTIFFASVGFFLSFFESGWRNEVRDNFVKAEEVTKIID